VYAKASLGNYVWVDGNNDGQQGNGADIGLNGVTVNLYKGDGTLVATTTTANNGGNPGYYLFSDLVRATTRSSSSSRPATPSSNRTRAVTAWTATPTQPPA